MRLFILLAAISILTMAADGCRKGEHTVYKGRLEIKALCMNYTISIMEGPVDTSLVSALWTNESTGKSYNNVFGLGSPCTFPANINEGDEFYFTIDNGYKEDCAVCLAYYPTPSKKLPIKVVEK